MVFLTVTRATDMNRFTLWKRRQLGRSFVASAALLAAALLPGCGPSQEEMLIQAARRNRPMSGGATANEATARASEQVTTTEESTRSANGDGSSTVAADTEPADSEAAADFAAIEQRQAIEQRRPEQPWSPQQRRARAHENLIAVAAALDEYYAQNERFPKPYSKTAAGLKGLSWRVELLPYLGHHDLYERFDFSKPWNLEPNRSLLKYIPPEYVSPERFDTKTNYLLAAGDGFLFGENKARAKFQIDDGPESTILMVEAADSQAVPWTQPQDFSPEDNHDFRSELFGPREDGAFAVWANGAPVLLARDLTAQQLSNAFTYESGDGQLAGAVHQDIAVQLNAGSDPPRTAAAGSLAATASDTMTTARSAREAGAAGVAAHARHAVPTAGDIARAQQRLREIFAGPLQKARSRSSKLALAQEMVQRSRAMSQDHTGAYALQTAAMRVASDAGGLNALKRAVECRTEQFTVDRYEAHVEALLEFGQRAVQHRGRSAARLVPDGLAYAEWAVKVLHETVRRDDYDRAVRLAGYAARFTEGASVERLADAFERLRSLLDSSRSQYFEATQQVAAYRQDPSNAEAAAAVGRFLCFIKGDWHEGLPLLSRDENASLKRAVESDLEGVGGAIDELAIGDAWWQLAEQATSPVYRQGSLERAAHWYRRALARLPESLDRFHAQARLKEIGESEPTTPLASVRRIAEILGVELEASLAAPNTTRS